MLRNSIVRLVSLCTRQPWRVIALASVLTIASLIYTAQNFALSTDTKALFPPSLPWAQQAFRYMRAFPQPGIIAVIDAPTAEDAAQASDRLGTALAARTDVIRAIHQPQSGEFFARNGLLYLPKDEVARLSAGLAQAGPVLSSLSADPSLRGALNALSLGLMGVEAGAIPLDELARPMNMAADTASAALADRPASFSWRALASGKAARPGDLRRFIEIEPKLDFKALQPGLAATQAIGQTVRKLDLTGRYQARVRLTGLIPINDDQFATLKHHAGLNAALTLAAVGVILWLALGSPKIMLAVALSIGVGLSVSAAVGLLLVGALNLISVAFFVLFVGLGIDFGIQFSVRYRAERHELGELRPALLVAAKKAALPLALAAVATAVGFAAFVPTDYRGLSELGEIAGCGMLIAFAASITLLPALLAVLKPGAERRPMGFAALAPVDRFLVRRRVPVVAATLIAVAAASPLLMQLRFDFNPLHLRNPSSPATAAFLDLRKDPALGANAIELTRPSLVAADATAKQLATLSQVARTMTLSSLVPADQGEKLTLTRKAASAIGKALDPAKVEQPPSDAQNIEALRSTAAALGQTAAKHPGPGAAAAKRLSGLLSQLAKADPAVRARVVAAVAPPLRYSLGALK
ncbi:MAG TPA: MMPL family transporter, partial [Stellaceae bacterium]|nr:MMPL family transporter [Stellaceae bacterium]